MKNLLALGLALALAACGEKPALDAAGALHGVACYSCHGDRYHDPTLPIDHEHAGFATTCADCHETTHWSPAVFGDHDAYWPLTGAHAEVSCASCHFDGVYAGTPRDCAGCHTPDYEATTDPDHVASAYPKTCEVCHTTAAWVPAVFEGHDQYWVLEGRHLETDCSACHVGEVYQGTPRECDGCHMPDFQATTDPDHVAAQLPTTCATCHTAAGWRPATLDHDDFWPLEGAHVEAECAACHESTWAGTPRTCDGCHMPDYEATEDPDHLAQSYPTSCQTCHNQEAWEPADWDGHDAVWPLRGQHAQTDCSACHVGGVYEGTPRACDGCHMPDYDGATNPAHAAPLLPTSCADCHTEEGWAPADIPTHDLVFIVSSGDHRRFSCGDCHQDASSWARFTCVGCHTNEHALTWMNAEHDEVQDYSATLAAYPTVDQGCLHCHPRGVEGDD